MPKLRPSADSKPSKSSFVPEQVQSGYGNEYPRIQVMPPFLLAYSPESWTMIEGRVVPQLKKFFLLAGVNGVSKNGKRWRLGALRSRLEEMGFTEIPWAWGPDGSYVVELDTLDKFGNVRTTYVSAFSEVYAGSSAMGADTVGYVEWLEGLMADGKLPAPAPYIIEGLIADRHSKLMDARTTQRTAPTDSRAATIANLESELEQLRAMSAGGKKTPARKRTAKLEADA